MSNSEKAEFDVRLRAARLRQELDERRDLPSPEWVGTVVEEGERRDREQRDAEASPR
jgi:hypothetical protein